MKTNSFFSWLIAVFLLSSCNHGSKIDQVQSQESTSAPEESETGLVGTSETNRPQIVSNDSDLGEQALNAQPLPQEILEAFVEQIIAPALVKAIAEGINKGFATTELEDFERQIASWDEAE